VKRHYWKKTVEFALVFTSLALVTWTRPKHLGYVATGYDAKVMCSSVSISGRSPKEVQKNDLLYTRIMPVKLDVDMENREVRATVSGSSARRAVYREGLGCTLAIGVSDDELATQAHAAPPAAPPLREGLLCPEGNAVNLDELPPEVNQDMLEQALGFAFTNPSPFKKLGTRAVVVVYKGRIIAERYAPGFSENTPLVGWSMTKSVTNALVGILVQQGKLDVYAPEPVPEWQSPEDPRSEITLDQLLRMCSGLKWADHALTTDILNMMYLEPDTAAFAASIPLAHPPGSKWSYSSGTTNIVSRIIRQAVGGSDADYFAFPYRELFHKLGMNSAVLEPDASGTFVGSSYLYATARDWARFGQLYLQDGVWNGERILPEGWVAYSVTPTLAAPQGGYGAQFWLNAGSPDDPDDRWMPKLPTDIYSTRGLDGQFVTVIPSHDLVVVRLGLTINYMKRWDHQQFLRMIMEAVLFSSSERTGGQEREYFTAETEK